LRKCHKFSKIGALAYMHYEVYISLSSTYVTSSYVICHIILCHMSHHLLAYMDYEVMIYPSFEKEMILRRQCVGIFTLDQVSTYRLDIIFISLYHLHCVVLCHMSHHLMSYVTSSYVICHIIFISLYHLHRRRIIYSLYSL
jgi:hypothetical protein